MSPILLLKKSTIWSGWLISLVDIFNVDTLSQTCQKNLVCKKLIYIKQPFDSLTAHLSLQTCMDFFLFVFVLYKQNLVVEVLFKFEWSYYRFSAQLLIYSHIYLIAASKDFISVSFRYGASYFDIISPYISRFYWHPKVNIKNVNFIFNFCCKNSLWHLYAFLKKNMFV